MFDECFCRRRNGLFKKRNELFAKCVRLFIERKFNTPFARQRVNDEGIFGTLYFFKQDRGFLFLQRAGGNLGDFENGVDFNADAVEFTVFSRWLTNSRRAVKRIRFIPVLRFASLLIFVLR